MGCGGRETDKAIDIGDVRIDFKRFDNLSALMDTHLLGFREEVFDRILCFETLEHCDSPFHVLKEFKRVLKANGKILVSLPNVWYWRRIIHTKPKRFTVDPPSEEYHKQGWDIHEFYSLAHSVGLEVSGDVWLNWYGQKRRYGFLDLFFRFLPQIAFEHSIYRLMKVKSKCGLDRELWVDFGSCAASKKEGYLSLNCKNLSSVDIVDDVSDLHLVANSVESAYSRRCIQHVKDDFKALTEIYRTLQPNGDFTLVVSSWLGYTYYKLGLSHSEKYAVFHLYTKKKLIAMLTKAGFKDIAVSKVKTARFGFDYQAKCRKPLEAKA